MDESNSKSYGVIVNSFLELEGEFAEHYRDSLSGRAWHVGPVSLSHRIEDRDRRHWLNWLDSKERDAVIYVCFGSQANFSTSQLNELASGLLDSNHYFIWIVRKESPQLLLDSELSESNKGIVIRGWAPQLRILNHESIGGFVTHCGWNSVMEGVSTGKPMVTWPVFGDQAVNEKLVVDELKIGVRVGARIKDESEKEPPLIKSGDIVRAIKKVMGKDEEEVMRMRRKAKKLGEEARRAVEEGGSSWREMQRLVEDLMSLNKDLVT
ncbi:uncharacterized protein A4U43_C05F11390 [Asparagus officinalis]|uniref:Uncharacterized protein n=1 Tax=Asparagus officinalis TaxID=4686 RepID=A0A5P1ETJ1_ASPOF|nr:scopoletin glucosyltransferase-like [Asparagus officinalis]ONK68427.1 uncharacterized protein A4U43_C05F11390 [Asparagus officinalis]